MRGEIAKGSKMGRLDDKIAMRVMGWALDVDTHGTVWIDGGDVLPCEMWHPSGDQAQCMQVIFKMLETPGWQFAMGHTEDGKWWAEFCMFNMSQRSDASRNQYKSILRAALRARKSLAAAMRRPAPTVQCELDAEEDDE